MLQRVLALLLFAVATCCTGKSGLSQEQLAEYEKQINDWHAHRIEQVKSRDGWLNLLGLYWLEPGINTFGTGGSNKIVFPDSTVSEKAGYFLVVENRVEVHLNKIADARINGRAIQNEVVFNSDSTRQPLMENDRAAWTVIRRDGKFGVRVRDLTMKGLNSFHGVERFQINPAYRIEAKFQPSVGNTIDITNVIGQTTAQASPGTLSFKWQDEEYRLDVLEGGKSEYFIIIADETSGRETYAGGRYLYVSHEDPNGNIVLDFNKAYNPPCVFTPYATCPLPPRQNVLPFSIYAGEKNYNHELNAAE
ncbi:DUF1684 domain-containing protein [Chryseolinea sp. T2]|uniref:DUF1684 domain-containing protein n=1 Tax=Chryseolinea sp. T2 TaxID=3129255 RepID=UPI0030780A99